MTRVLTKSLAEFLIIFWLLWAGDTLNLIFVSFQETFDLNTDLKKYALFEWHYAMLWCYVNSQNVFTPHFLN